MNLEWNWCYKSEMMLLCDLGYGIEHYPILFAVVVTIDRVNTPFVVEIITVYNYQT